MDKNELIEIMRDLRDKREKEIFETNHFQNKEISVEQIYYVGKYEFVQDIDGKERTVEKDVFCFIEKEGNKQFLKYYDQDMELLAVEIPENGQILPTRISQEKYRDVTQKIGQRDKKEDKSLDELEDEKEKEEAKKEKMSQDLSAKDNGFKVTYYKEIVDPKFKQLLSKTCQGAEEVGIAYSAETGETKIVGKYNGEFKQLPGTNDAKLAMRAVSERNENNGTVSEKVPYSTIAIDEFSRGDEKMEIAITKNMGYLDLELVHVKGMERVKCSDVRMQGEGWGEEITKQKMDEFKEEGRSHVYNEMMEIEANEKQDSPEKMIDLSKDVLDNEKELKDINLDLMKQEIKENILTLYEKELNSLYNYNKEMIEESVGDRIDKAIYQIGGKPMNVQTLVEESIKSDIEAERDNNDRGRKI